MSQSNLLIVKLSRRFVIGTFTGAIAGFSLGVLDFSNLQTTLMTTLIGGISFGIAKVILIIGKTWWQNSLFWVKTMGVTISVLTGIFTGAIVGFSLGVLDFSHLQTALITTLIGSISFGIAEVISIIGKTWWQNSLLWGTTMGVTIGVLTRLLLPSVDLDTINVIAACITYSLGVNYCEKVLLIR